MLPNGNLNTFTEKEKIELDRRISNMLTFKPDLSKINEENKTENLERTMALELVDIVNKRSKFNVDSTNDEIKYIEDTELNVDCLQKATQTDFKSPNNSLRRKSIQLVNKFFNQDDDIENRKIDDQNSEGDCKASPLDIFRYPNIRKKFFILTFNWVALGVVYNSLSYNTPNLGVDDYLAFFIGKLYCFI